MSLGANTAEMMTNGANVAGKGLLEVGKNFMPPSQFARSAVGGILGFVGAIAPPLLTLALAGMGLDMTVRGKDSKLGKFLNLA